MRMNRNASIFSSRQLKFHIMKNLSGVRSVRNKTAILLLMCGFGHAVFAQFQSTIGFPYPVGEESPGGIVLPTGGYAIPAGNNDHPASTFGPGNTDWQIVLLNPGGNVASPAKWLGKSSADNAVWMELSSCSGQNGYIIAGNDGGDMTLTLTNLAGAPVWTRNAGTTANVESAACVKVDGSGHFVLVGTQLNVSTGQQNVVVARVDCNGTMLWNRVFSFTGLSVEASSVTAFSTFIGICPQPNTNKYYITGKATPMAGGDDQVFLLSVDAGSGAFGFMNVYDVNPAASDAGTCIQSSCITTAQPEIWISGYSDDPGIPARTVLMLKTDINGIPVWANNYDIANGDEFATHFTFGPNGKLVVTGKAEESVVFQGTKGGNCMMTRIDGSGSSVDWTRVYTNNGFSSQGNRVEPASNGAYFVTGQALELLTPSQSANNILAILTDNSGQTNPSCFNSLTTTVIPRAPMPVTVPGAQLSISSLDFFNNSSLSVQNYTDQQTNCSTPACVCDFSYTTGNCFQVNFTASCTPPPPGNYVFEWDINCDGPDATTATPNYTYTFPCGGGTYSVCLKVYLNGTLCSSVTHPVTVPSTCCGPILTKVANCTPQNNVYAFSIEVGNSPGAASCQQPAVSISSSVATLSGPGYVNNGNSWTITGLAQVATSTTTALVFSVQTVCLCPVSGLPMTCNQTVVVPLPCCKTIHVADREICHDLASFNVPIQVGTWSPLNNIQQVTWYVMAKPAGGCPAPPWGIAPYQSNITTTLDPLHLYPNSLPVGEYCVYAVVNLDDGPCQLLTSNVATLKICRPNGCSLNSYDYCYSGTPVLPGQLLLTPNSPPSACAVTSVEWYDPQGNPVQSSGSLYTPVQAIGMQNPQLCYEDYFYTVKITDACGVHSCDARIRLYSGLASVGTLSLNPPGSQLLCYNGSATVSFLPKCAGDPPKWDWYQQDCIGGALMPLPDAGTTNGSYNTGQLDQSYYFIVEAANAICPPRQEPLLVEVKSPLAYINFSASSDPCVEQYVDLTLDIAPCTLAGCGTPCNCTYTADWFKDGNYIGTTPGVTPPTPATFHYSPVGLPVYGNYYAVLKADCCPGESVTTYPIYFRQSCDPVVMGPCFICDNQQVQLMAQMVLPPDDPCPDVCTYFWYSYDPIAQTETPLGPGPVWNTGTGGFYILESDCYGCIKRDTFELIECYSNPCRRAVTIEELFAEKERPLRFYPNPATDLVTVEWTGDVPKNAQILITDPDGRVLRSIAVPETSRQLTISLDNLPSGIFFVKVRSADQTYTAAKLVKE